MLIVYQSLESVGNKEDTAITPFTGNSFKHKTQQNILTAIPTGPFNFTTPKYHEKSNSVSMEVEEKHFATSAESINLFNRFKTEPDKNLRKKKLESMLEKIIERIVINTIRCTPSSSSSSAGSRPPHLIVLGEMYGIDIKGLRFGNYVVVDGMNPTGDARHRFTILKHVHCTDDIDFQFFSYLGTSSHNKDEQAVCVIMKIKGWLTAFVHTPNKICSVPLQATNYIKNNLIRTTGSDKGLDLLIGDTNQQSSSAVATYMETNYDRNKWQTSITHNEQQVTGPDGVTLYKVKGTNSGFDKHFDIASSPHPVIKMEDITPTFTSPTEEPPFIFHGLTDKFFINDDDGKLYAYTDHNGVIVEILRDKLDHFQNKENHFRKRKRDDFIQSQTQKENKIPKYNLLLKDK